MAGLFETIGDVLGTSNTESINKAKGQLDNIYGVAQETARQNRGLYDSYMGQMRDMYGDNAAQYQDAVARLGNAIGEGPESFAYTGNVNDFYDKFAGQAQQQAMDAINQSASAGGNRFSSNYTDKLAAKQRALSTEAWKTAYDTMMRDRQQQMAEWQAGQAARQNYIGNLGTMANLYGSDRNQLADATSNYYSNLANQNNANLEAYSDVMSGKANLDAQRSNGVGDFVGSVGKLAGAIFG